MDLDKAAKILNAMNYLGRKDWEVNWEFDRARVMSMDSIILNTPHAIETAEDYLAFCASNGGVPVLDDEAESKTEKERATMGLSKEKIAEILNEAEHAGYSNWRYENGFIVAGYVKPVMLSLEAAEKIAQICIVDQIGKEDEAAESKPSPLDVYDAEYNPIPVKVIERLEAMGELARDAENFDDNETINLAIQLISGKSSVNSIPSADEALAIINEEGHCDDEWELFAIAVDHDSNVLTYEELIGTSMYYKAKRVKS